MTVHSLKHPKEKLVQARSIPTQQQISKVSHWGGEEGGGEEKSGFLYHRYIETSQYISIFFQLSWSNTSVIPLILKIIFLVYYLHLLIVKGRKRKEKQTFFHTERRHRHAPLHL